MKENTCKRCGEYCKEFKNVCDTCYDEWIYNEDIYHNDCMVCHRKHNCTGSICNECKNRETPYLDEIKPGDYVEILDSDSDIAGDCLRVTWVGDNLITVLGNDGNTWNFDLSDVKKVDKPNEDLKKLISDDNLTSADKISKICKSLETLLLEKNKRYGDNALRPIQTFSKADPIQQILNRLDDKLSRIKNSDELRKNDVSDVAGYLVLLCAAKDWLDFSDLID